MNKHFSGCEIVEIGIQIEKNGKDFYNKLSEIVDDEQAKSVFTCLAHEEDKHIDVLKNIFSEACDYAPEGAYPDEYFAYMNALSNQYVFTKENKGTEIAEKVADYKEGIDIAIGFEKDSILFYEEVKNFVPEKDKEIVEKLINEEKKHLRKLCDVRNGGGE
jgi:rubrerythrin